MVQTWGQLEAAKAQITATQAQVAAAEIALNGVREEARVGQRTTLDVLNAQQELVNARVALVTAQRDRVVASYSLLAATGRLSVAVLGLQVPIYDPMTHYQQVRDSWFGVRTPGRQIADGLPKRRFRPKALSTPSYLRWDDAVRYSPKASLNSDSVETDSVFTARLWPDGRDRDAAMTQPAKAQEPSMEEILASIRRIISDDDAANKAPASPPKAAAPAAPPPRAEAPRPAPAPPKPAAPRAATHAAIQNEIEAVLARAGEATDDGAEAQAGNVAGTRLSRTFSS